jgi:GNAT superfamily N-acetyltransferase
MHHHPDITGVDLSSVGVWETGGEIVGAVHMELHLGTAYFEIDPTYSHLKREMLSYAEENLSAPTNGGRELTLYINDRDRAFQAIAEESGYGPLSRSEAMSSLAIPTRVPSTSLPEGFELKSSEKRDDLRKMHRLLHRGFNHGAEPPDDGVASRRFMESAPNYQRDLNIVIQAPDGGFASYCGIWYEPTNRVAYVEPVATDPDYRRMGLARAAVLEAVRRCACQGARVAYVGSTLPIYLSVGFRLAFNCSAWQRRWL